MMTPEEAMKRCQTGCTDLQMANNLLASCYGVIGSLDADNKYLAGQRQWLEGEVKRARLDERQAMTYLSQVRIAAEFEGDFPSLVKHVATMAEALRAAHEMTKAAWVEGSNAGWKAARGEQ